jgi:hypothetical protein
MHFELPATGRDQAPAFLAAQDCRDWLVKVPLANPSQAQAIVLRQLGLLHHFDLPVSERLAILEELRGSVCKLQEDASRGFAARPLPLAPLEQHALETSLEVWNLLALGYLRCFSIAADGRGKEAATLQALLAQRTLSVFADWQVDLCRGEQLPDGSYWLKLHRILAAAESLGVIGLPVDDAVRLGQQPTSALAAYAECNLLSSASLYELPARHLGWVARWARRWGGKLALLSAPPEDIRNRAQPLCVDLESDQPAGYLPRITRGGRWLETTELKKSLLSRITLLEQGHAPATMQLGDDVTQPAATHLLRRAMQRWCQGGTLRAEARSDSNGACHVVVGFDAVHRLLTGGKVFTPPNRDTKMLRREREEFETFGNLRHMSSADTLPENAHTESWRVVDDWQLLNTSPAGMRLSRTLAKGSRIGAGQLIAVRTPDGLHFSLAVVRWALREGNDTLTAGIQLLPGEPRPATVRVLDANGTASAWQQAFALPEIAALRIPASLVLRSGSFRLDRRIEVMVDQQLQAMTLYRILDHGNEFERCITRAPD